MFKLANFNFIYFIIFPRNVINNFTPTSERTVTSFIVKNDRKSHNIQHQHHRAAHSLGVEILTLVWKFPMLALLTV